MPKSMRVKVVLLVVLLLAAAAAGFSVALRLLKDKVVEALGEGAEVGAVSVGWSGVTVTGLRLQGPPGWPAPDALRAERVTVAPSLGRLLAGEVRVGSVRVVRPYLSALRSRDGRLRLLPGLLEAPARKGAPASGQASGPAPPVTIGTVALEEGVAELYDATVATPPLRIRLEEIRATVREIALPGLTGKTEFDLTGVVKGVKRDGQAAVGGWVEVATKDSSVTVRLRGVDLVAFRPYLGRAADVKVERGTLDLDLASEVRQNRLKAPGAVTIADLELAPSPGAVGSFMGMSRNAILGAMKDRSGRISVKFVLEGDIASPTFSLNEALSTRLAASLADSLGVGIRQVAEGAGGLGRKGAEAVGQTVKGLGDSVQRLFGGQER